MKRLMKSQYFGPLVTLAAILLFNAFFTPGFFRVEILDGHFYGNVIDILKNAAPLMLLSIGMTMVIATGGIDISVGSVIAISGAVACSIIDSRLGFFDGSFIAAVAFGLLAGLACGLWNGFLIAKMRIQPVVATLILLTAGRGIAQLVTKGKIVTINSAPMVDAYYFIGAGYMAYLPFAFLLALAVLALYMSFTRKTAYGLFLKSSGINEQASRMAGISVDAVKMIAYASSGLMAALAGLMISSNIKGADCNNAGLFMELDAILAVSLAGNSMSGGKFSIPASIIGALILQCLTTTIYAFGVPPETIAVVKAAVVIVICLFQSPQFRSRFSRRTPAGQGAA